MKNVSSASVFNGAFLSLVTVALLLAIPFTDLFVFDTKKLFLLLTGLGILGYTAFQLWKQKSLTFSFSPFYTALTFLGAAVLTSTFLSNPYPYESLFGWGGILVALTLVAGKGAEIVSKKHAAAAPTAIGAIAAALTVVTGLQAFGYGPSHLYNMALGGIVPNNALFSVTESLQVVMQVMLVAAIGLLAVLFRKDAPQTQPLHLGLCTLVIAGLGLSVWFAFIKPLSTNTQILPWSTNITVIKGVLSSPKSALIGMGPNSFSHAYNAFRPASTNLTDYWNVEFSSGSNLPLTLLVTTGLLGFIGWAALVVFFIRHLVMHSKVRNNALTWMVATLFTLQVAFPPSIVTLILFAVVFAYWLNIQSEYFEQIKLHTLITRLTPDKTKSASVSITHIISLGLSLIIILVILASVYGMGRAFAASYLLFRSTLVSTQEGNATTIYELQKQAVVLNPYIDTVRRRYALTNIAIAQALANKQDLTEEERGQILELIQQAIREGRAAALLQPDDSRNWETLANIYQNLLGVATGADQWSVSSYTRAIENDPSNPALWFQLGRTFYQIEQYSDSVQAFSQAIKLKPDYVSAFYNLAYAHKHSGQNEKAVATYQALLKLLPADSPDHAAVTIELAEFEASMEASSDATPAASLVESSVTPTQDTVGAQSNSDLSGEAKEYLEATPIE